METHIYSRYVNLYFFYHKDHRLSFLMKTSNFEREVFASNYILYISCDVVHNISV